MFAMSPSACPLTVQRTRFRIHFSHLSFKEFTQAPRLLEVENLFPPSQTVYEYGFNFDKMDFSLWEEPPCRCVTRPGVVGRGLGFRNGGGGGLGVQSQQGVSG